MSRHEFHTPGDTPDDVQPGTTVTLFPRPDGHTALLPLLGRHQVHDPRSRAYAVAEPSRWPDPAQTVVHARYGPLWDQGRLGSCVAHAALGCLMTAPLWRPGWAFTEADCVALYQRATVLDDAYGIPGQYPPTDTGSCFLGAAKALRERKLISSFRHAFGLKAALGALSAGPISVGIPWYDSFFTPNSQGLLSISPDAQVVGGHQIPITALYVSEQVVGFANSWGTGWGARGWGFLRWATLDRLLSEGGDVGVLVP